MIYLDHHAAAPVCEAARLAIEAAREECWANASSQHAAGRTARAHLDEARRRIASAIGAAPGDLVLTGGGTEACNLGVLGGLGGRRRVVTTAVEHPSVRAAIEASSVADVISLACLDGEPPDAEALAPHLGGDVMVAMQWVNHETGVIFPIAEYALACREARASLFVDATQALGKIPIDVGELPGITSLAIASHKVGGPAGAGALWVRRGAELEPLSHGGSQERGRRAGSPDVLAQVGFGAACRELPTRLEDVSGLLPLRRQLEAAMVDLGFVINAPDSPRVPTVVDASLPGWRGEVMAAALDVEGVCASSGAACSSGLSQRSAVVAAMYPEAEWRAECALRLSFGPETTEADITAAVAALRRVVGRDGASGDASRA